MKAKIVNTRRLLPRDLTWIDSVSVVFHYNGVPPQCARSRDSNTAESSVKRQDMEAIYKHPHHGTSLHLIAGPCCGFWCSHFPRRRVSKMAVLTFVKSTNQHDAACWRHIFGSTQIAWNPSRESTNTVLGTRYYHLLENPKNQVEQTRPEPSRY